MTTKMCSKEIGFYTVKKAPRGGWWVLYTLNDRVRSRHNNKEEAVAAAVSYMRGYHKEEMRDGP